MKLRNKKTGKSYIVHIGTSEIGNIHLVADDYIAKQVLVYETLAELNEEWEDYELKGPLIKDEKIRKAVRTWAEVNSIKEIIIFDYKNAGLRASHGEVYFAENGGHLEICFRTEERFDTDRRYTIAELCGDKE